MMSPGGKKAEEPGTQRPEELRCTACGHVPATCAVCNEPLKRDDVIRCRTKTHEHAACTTDRLRALDDAHARRASTIPPESTTRPTPTKLAKPTYPKR
jgi:hypothetical protein